MRLTMSTKLTVRYDMKAADFAAFFNAVPANARISIDKSKYYDQRDPGETTITATWTEDKTSSDVGVTAWRDR